MVQAKLFYNEIFNDTSCGANHWLPFSRHLLEPQLDNFIKMFLKETISTGVCKMVDQ